MKYLPFYLCYGILFLLYILNLFFQSSMIHLIVSWGTLGVFLLSWRRAANLFKWMSTMFILTGIFMSLTSGVSWYLIPQQFTNNFPMLVFLSMLPWMASAFSIGEYDQILKDMINPKNNQLADMYGKGLAATYSLLIFINISAIYLVQQVLIDKLKGIDESIRNDFIIRTTLKAFSLAVIWSPMEIIVGITVDATNISFFSYLPWLLLCSFLLITIDVSLNKKRFAEMEINLSANINHKELMKALLKLFFVLFTFFSIILISNHLFALNFILTVSLVIFPFTFIWAVFTRRASTFLTYGWKSWKNYNNNMQNFVVLFLSLALFSEGFKQTAIPHILQKLLGQVSEYALLIFIFITFIYFVMGLIGVHPVATIAILIEVLNPLFHIINPMSIGIVLIMSALATSASAPYGINATLTSQTIGVSPFYITKINFPFSILMSVVGIAVAMIVL
ncbi:hypothetical protein [Oceanobacillus sp. FSL W7-1281]|uniref:hypothetical protein n=1 Tax=Oceanobacillus sp. FSL W7-1281 TaxID=2921698 RepID=UPI0030D96A0B